ncbi:DUF2797 domain-containing protein [Saccharobesus litoralis]|uniref:DUF2797 domain-containing protein n=1 Tax=Saccharobesus litoralis TaxID=2172099 RepID=A0A2S0VS38_9ALTE|nr:DUF2797 domain-containing protein [Saccharobesus litoralis]AWB67019.1 DUF2797 domain-containing protein [Saccharobesus litoralis]
MLGTIKKLTAQLDCNTHKITYQLPLSDDAIELNPLIGQPIKMRYTGEIFCCHCGRKTKKSFSQGHCYPCMQKLASCDMCIMKPETCHYEQGTCREPEWGQANCMIPHYVYLSNTSGLKVGITRHTQIPTRWIDQGATQALPIFQVKTRQLSGLVEVELAKFIADKTNWRAMLKGLNPQIDLKQAATELKPQIQQKLTELLSVYGSDAIEELNADVVDLDFPVEQYPSKVTSFNFDKNPEVSGILQGIKGQYLILDTGVINMRKFTSYQIEFSCEADN